MQRDFHYYCVGTLAKAAGFSREEALVIAYASQYVDDSTENEPIRVGDLFFDPVRTAHYGLKAFEWSVQKRIYIPFHFLPPAPIRSARDTFVTTPNSPFAQMIFQEACQELHPLCRLCRIGIAVHTLADTWAHQGFSGREHQENNVEGISHYRGSRWRRLLLENVYLDLLPQIGHAEAGYFPDQPFLQWKYTNAQTHEERVRDNTKDFHIAAKVVYKNLCRAAESSADDPIPWEEIEQPIRDLLAVQEPDVEQRCARWKAAFQSLFDSEPYAYDKLLWRNQALEPRDETDTLWDDFPPSEFRRLAFPMKRGFYETPWVQFHRAALRQRHYVLEHLL